MDLFDILGLKSLYSSENWLSFRYEVANSGKSKHRERSQQKKYAFERGELYRFRRRCTTKEKQTLADKAATLFQYIGEQKGQTCTYHLFRSINGGYTESFSPFQIEEHEIAKVV